MSAGKRGTGVRSVNKLVIYKSCLKVLQNMCLKRIRMIIKKISYYGHATGTNDPFGLFQVTSGKVKYKPIIANLKIAGETISIEVHVDTEASMTIIPESLFNNKLSEIKLKACNQTFFTYSGEPLQVLGQAELFLLNTKDKVSSYH